MKEKFVDVKFRDKSLKMIERCNDIIEDSEPGISAHVATALLSARRSQLRSEYRA